MKSLKTFNDKRLQFSVNKFLTVAFLSINSPVEILTNLGRG